MMIFTGAVSLKASLSRSVARPPRLMNWLRKLEERSTRHERRSMAAKGDGPPFRDESCRFATKRSVERAPRMTPSV
jgi:hypothetical protein